MTTPHAANAPTMQLHTCCLCYLSPPLRPCRHLTNTAVPLPPPSHPNNAAVHALRRCCPDNAMACPPLPRPLSLPTATACHCRPTSATPTMLHCATFGNPPLPDESPTLAHCRPMGIKMPPPTPMPPTLMPTPIPMPMAMQKRRNEWRCKMVGSGNCNGQWWQDCD
jgi:hypothetical protein